MAIKVQFVTNDKVLWKGETDFIVIPSTGGDMGIMTDHEPVMASLKEGLVKINGAPQEETKISGGFMSFYNNEASIVVDSTLD